MSTSSRPRRAGARASAAALAALTATGATLITAPAAVAAPGDPDDVVIHRVGFPFVNPRNQSRVCDFYLAAFNFNPREEISWRIDDQPPAPGAEPVVTGTFRVASDGNGYTQPVMPTGRLRLPSGQYRLTWNLVEGEGTGNRVFRVACPPVGPNGGPPAGGGGLAMPQDFSPVAGAAAVGLAAVGGVTYLRLRRRRADGAA